MSKLIWGIQTNLGNADKLVSACQSTGSAYQELMAVPFSEELPDVSVDLPVIFYGAVNFINTVWKSKRWNPGVFFDEWNFDYRCWSGVWGDHVLNSDAEVTTLEQFGGRSYSDDRLFFVKPVRDLKEFSGDVVSFGDLEAWCDRVNFGIPGFSEIPILVAEPVGIAREWRLFVVDGKVSSASRYQSYHRLDVSSEVPDEVIEFGMKMIAEWCPAPIFSLDVAQSGDRFYINEIGCFHSSGFYDSNVVDIVNDINNYILREHNG